jgi:hypothetical protein
MIYVEDHKGYGLGNFVNITPTIKKLSEEEEVFVYFHSELVKSAFLDCPFITILDEPLDIKPKIHSGMICKANDMPDYMYVWHKVFGDTNVTEHTYVDTVDNVNCKGDYVVVINGTGNEKETYTKLKRIPIEYYLEELKKEKYAGLDIVGIGSEKDLERLDGIKLRNSFTGIRICLAVLRNAHCAGAMNKWQKIFWKDTLTPKNVNPSYNTTNIRI